LYIILGLAIALAFITIHENYSASLTSDAHAYLTFAKAFSKLSYPQNPVLSIVHSDAPKEKFIVAHYSSYLLKDGKIISKTPLGYPLLLSPLLFLFNLNYVYCLNAIMIALIVLFTYLSGKEIFKDEGIGEYAGVIAILLLFRVNYNILDYSLMLSTDVTSLAILSAAFYYTLKEKKIGGLLLGFSLFIRLTNLAAALFLIIYLALKRKPNVILPYLAFFLIGASPLVIQDLLSENTITRQYANAIEGLVGSRPPSGISDVIPMEKETYLGALNTIYSIPVLTLALIGLLWGIKKKGVWMVMLPIIIVYTFAFSKMRIPESYRYLIITHPFMTLLASYGLIRAVKLISIKDEKLGKMLPLVGACFIVGDLLFNGLLGEFRIDYLDRVILLSGLSLMFYKLLPEDKKIIQLSIILAIPLLLAPSHYHTINPQPFQLKEAKTFAENINENTGDNSIILVCKYLGPIVDYYSNRHAIPPYTLNSEIDQLGQVIPEDFAVNMSRQVDKIRELMDASYSVYVIDNRRYNKYFGDLEDCGKMKDEYARYFKVTPVLTLDMEDYNLVGECGKRYCTLYELS